MTVIYSIIVLTYKTNELVFSSHFGFSVLFATSVLPTTALLYVMMTYGSVAKIILIYFEMLVDSW